MKCDTCAVQALVDKVEGARYCVWYASFVVCGDKTVEECTAYTPVEEKESNNA